MPRILRTIWELSPWVLENLLSDFNVVNQTCEEKESQIPNLMEIGQQSSIQWP